MPSTGRHRKFTFRKKPSPDTCLRELLCIYKNCRLEVKPLYSYSFGPALSLFGHYFFCRNCVGKVKTKTSIKGGPFWRATSDLTNLINAPYWRSIRFCDGCA